MGHHKQHRIEFQAMSGRARDCKVPDVNRVECAPEDANSCHRYDTLRRNTTIIDRKTTEKRKKGLDSPAPAVLPYPIAHRNVQLPIEQNYTVSEPQNIGFRVGTPQVKKSPVRNPQGDCRNNHHALLRRHTAMP